MTQTIIVQYTDDTMQEEQGVILNSHWSDAFGCWILLICTENGRIHSVRSDTLGMAAQWVDDTPNIMLLGGDTGNSDNVEEN